MSDPLDFTDKPTVLAVDDTPDNLSLVSGLLRDHYKVKVATGGERALKIVAAGPRPDLILLDIMMPDIDGYEVCQKLKADSASREIPVIFLTAKTDVEDEKKGLELGAVDYIMKPISPPILLARVKTHLALKAASDFLRDKSAYLESEVARRTKEISAVQYVTIMAMASLAETRNNKTLNHIRRTQNYVRALALQLKDHPRFAEYLTAEQIETLFKSVPLHDIGKAAVPDEILLKPGKCTAEEFEAMKAHAALGRDAILSAEKLLDAPSAFLQCAREIAYSHQEKWDGSGYPEGLERDAIPISARLMAVADVYDVLISRRAYKDGLPHEKAVAIIQGGRGSHFDPDIVDAFSQIHTTIASIAHRYSDTEHAGKNGQESGT